ncbi:hypothetical protein PHSY_002254 [Pseudozyma hubeiensis SY62]|uniref:Uncharacterized protein n=1 Tax=Pseudozyma hubeiensis (strain SY62) TaxID=1305764 RepID=R9P0K5_PSEHS|nr:hypothetical protein PHSY_002254 [Pseudozyma hubeiensis SY62]GAC94681.1 hypothetical protein PHSY_002254 [Pseudozyma hubeiensis SY62]
MRSSCAPSSAPTARTHRRRGQRATMGGEDEGRTKRWKCGKRGVEEKKGKRTHEIWNAECTGKITSDVKSYSLPVTEPESPTLDLPNRWVCRKDIQASLASSRARLCQATEQVCPPVVGGFRQLRKRRGAELWWRLDAESLVD